MKLKVKHSGGQFKYEFTEETCLVDFLATCMSEMSNKVKSVSDLAIKKGYPPVLVVSSNGDDLLVKDLQFSNGISLTAATGEMSCTLQTKAEASTTMGDTKDTKSVPGVPVPSTKIASEPTSGLDAETKHSIVENLMKMGNFSREVCLQAIGIAGTDLSLCYDICTSLQSSVLQPLMQTTTVAERKVIDADNSCLFNSIGFLRNGHANMNSIGMDPTVYRSMIGNTIMSEKGESYHPFLEGKSPHEYAAWIQNSEKWGGDVDIRILSDQLDLCIKAVDVESSYIHAFGKQDGDKSVIFVLFDGIHYDAIVMKKEDASGTSIKKVFALHSAEDIEMEKLSKELAVRLKQQKQFTNTSQFTLRCMVCSEGLIGEKEAREHAQSTGHQNFNEY